ncbi:Conserved protein of unknown function [Magnetospira sp. QH-2]|nr:Conserved protein of unknown function [Magnetospira sp. QH-2]
MEAVQVHNDYPVYVLDLGKDETMYQTVDEIILYLKRMINDTPKASYIGSFDHYDHTTRIGGEIGDEIQAARLVVFCFGFKLPNPEVLAVRPRSIGVADMGNRFVISFLEAPVNPANETIEKWLTGLHHEGEIKLAAAAQ